MAHRIWDLPPHDEAVQRPRLSGRDVIGIQQTLEELATARCPVCRTMLVARQARKGPVFFCRCKLVRKQAS